MADSCSRERGSEAVAAWRAWGFYRELVEVGEGRKGEGKKRKGRYGLGLASICGRWGHGACSRVRGGFWEWRWLMNSIGVLEEWEDIWGGFLAEVLLECGFGYLKADNR